MLELALLIRRLARLHNHTTQLISLFMFCYDDKKLLEQCGQIRAHLVHWPICAF